MRIPIAHERRRPAPDRAWAAHPAWISRLKARARTSRGVVIVEAAFVTPVFFILVLGVIEVGLAMNDNLALASTVRAGSRVASASGNDVKADVYTLLRISKESTALDRSSIEQIIIYKPASFGEGPSDLCKNGVSQPGVCNVYTTTHLTQAEVQVKEETAALAAGRAPDAAKIKFNCPTLTTSPDRAWCPTTRKVTQPNGGPDYVGVWMKIRHPWITKMFGSAKTLTDESVIRLEPRSS